MYALVMMLFDIATKKYHPIYYFEKPMPGPIEDQTILRYKSKGHHTAGFESHEEALKSANELATKLKETHIVSVELEACLPWDSSTEGIPTDTQIRPLPTKS